MDHLRRSLLPTEALNLLLELGPEDRLAELPFMARENDIAAENARFAAMDASEAAILTLLP